LKLKKSPKDDANVVAKFLKIRGKKDIIEEILKEINNMIALENHPNIAQFLDVTKVENKYVIFMEEANGGDLFNF